MEILLALLAGAGLVGFMLFGRPKSADQASPPAPDRIEQVQPKPESILPSEVAPAEVVPVKVENITPFPIVEIPDPWSDAPMVRSTPMLSTPSMAPFAAIQDPKRPSTPALQDLSQEILDMGQSQQLRFIPKLIQSANHKDSMIRTYAAYAMGQIAAVHTVVKAEIETMIPVLGKLTEDSSLEVRSMAIKALNQIRSPQVLPYLEKAASLKKF
jgi:HEAT repeats